MEVGSLAVLIIGVAGIAALVIYIDRKKTDREGHFPGFIYLMALSVKIFFVSMFLSWLALYLLKEINHAIVIVVVFYIVALLSLCSIPLFFNTLTEVKTNYFLSALSFFLVPLIASVVVLQNLLENWPDNRSEFSIFLPTMVCFFVSLIFYFVKFRKKISQSIFTR